MKLSCILFAIGCVFGSCATIMNESTTRIKLHTTSPSKVIFNADTLQTANNKVVVKAKRDSLPLSMVVLSEGVRKTIQLKPINSFAYYYNILGNLGIGMLMEKTHPKRYGYPKNIYVNSTDTSDVFYKYSQENKKGHVNLHLSFPHLNSFLLKPENEGVKINTGFWGLSIGMDYYHQKHQFLSFVATGATDFFVPTPAMVDLSEEHEFMNTIYGSISNNHEIKRLTIGYGLSIARNTWDLRHFRFHSQNPPTRTPAKKSANAIGLIFPLRYFTGNHFFIGMIYRPTFYQFSGRTSIAYEHLLSLDFGWKIKLKK